MPAPVVDVDGWNRLEARPEQTRRVIGEWGCVSTGALNEMGEARKIHHNKRHPGNLQCNEMSPWSQGKRWSYLRLGPNVSMAPARDFAAASAPPPFSCTDTPMHLQNDTDKERFEVSYVESKHIDGTCE